MAESAVNGVGVHYVEHGDGTPVLGLHGVDVDHREIAGCLEPVFADRPGYRRIYPDLPGMGDGGRVPRLPRRPDPGDAAALPGAGDAGHGPGRLRRPGADLHSAGS